jgi:hypothetical protein
MEHVPSSRCSTSVRGKHALVSRALTAFDVLLPAHIGPILDGGT